MQEATEHTGIAVSRWSHSIQRKEVGLVLEGQNGAGSNCLVDLMRVPDSTKVKAPAYPQITVRGGGVKEAHPRVGG